MRENWWEILDGCCRCRCCCCCCCCPKAPPGTKTALAAAAASAAAADRRVARAPPGTKTARHGRTNRPQNRTEKVPNVTSETLLELKTWGNWWEILDGCCRCCRCCCCWQKSTKSTSRHQNSKARKDEQAQNRTEKVSNVTSGTLTLRAPTRNTNWNPPLAPLALLALG